MEGIAHKLHDTATPLELQIKPGGQLGSETETLAKLRTGQLDMLGVNLTALANTSHTANILTLPFLFRNTEHAWKVLHGTVGKRLEAELLADNLVLLGYFDAGFRCFYSSRPIHARQDFKGMKVRVSAGANIYSDFIRQLGATPVSLPYGEIFDAFKNGKIDAADGSIVSYITSEHYKHAKYLSIDAHSVSPDVLLMSKKAWSNLSAAQQKQIKADVIDANKKIVETWQHHERELLAHAQKEGVTVIPHEQMNMTGIEDLAYHTYNKYLQDPKDLDLVMGIFEAGE